MASDSETGAGFDFASSSTVPVAMQKIGKHKANRAEIQKGIGKDHVARLASLKKRVEAHYKDEAQNIAALEAHKLWRLIRALERRRACEDEISRRAGALRDDCAHMAMLLGAVYAGRAGAAAAVADKTRGSLSAIAAGVGTTNGDGTGGSAAAAAAAGGGAGSQYEYEKEKKMGGGRADRI